MRNVLVFISTGVVLLFGCAHAQPPVPQPAGIARTDQHHSGLSPARLPKHFRILYSFQDGADGAMPFGDLFRDAAGNLYGAAGGSQYRYGIVFKLDPSGNETVLHAFDGGFNFYGSLLQDPAGNLYGNTPGTGSGGGVVFKLDPHGNYTVLHTFQGGSDGASPNAGMVMDSAGNLYGVTEFGGASGSGAIFKIDPSGNETVIHSLSRAGGSEPHGGLVGDSAGNLYGTTRIGGRYGPGVVFKVNCEARSGSECGNYTVVHNFDGQYRNPPPFHTNDGDESVARLVRGVDGSMYGTAELGGLGDGVIFKVDPNGHERVLLNFGSHHGEFPKDDLAVDGSGNVYGTMDETDFTAAYMVDSGGFFTVLHTFDYEAGDGPSGSLICDAAGNLYGTANGGPLGHGVVYELSP